MEQESNACNPNYKTCPYKQQDSYMEQDMYQQPIIGQTHQSMNYPSERPEEYIPVISYVYKYGGVSGHSGHSGDFWYGDGPYYPNYYYGKYPYPYPNYPYYPIYPYPRLN